VSIICFLIATWNSPTSHPPLCEAISHGSFHWPKNEFQTPSILLLKRQMVLFNFMHQGMAKKIEIFTNYGGKIGSV
jgi:hypothetical protein